MKNLNLNVLILIFWVLLIKPTCQNETSYKDMKTASDSVEQFDYQNFKLETQQLSQEIKPILGKVNQRIDHLKKRLEQVDKLEQEKIQSEIIALSLNYKKLSAALHHINGNSINDWRHFNDNIRGTINDITKNIRI